MIEARIVDSSGGFLHSCELPAVPDRNFHRIRIHDKNYTILLITWNVVPTFPYKHCGAMEIKVCEV